MPNQFINAHAYNGQDNDATIDFMWQVRGSQTANPGGWISHYQGIGDVDYDGKDELATSNLLVDDDDGTVLRDFGGMGHWSMH